MGVILSISEWPRGRELNEHMRSALQLGCAGGGPTYRMRRWKIGHGDSAINKTTLHMQALVLGPEGVGHPAVRIAAVDAARGSVKNVNEIEAVLAWVKRNIEFRGENAETLQSPAVTLQLRAGDCDDHSMLIAAMVKSLGYQVQFKTVATQRMSPGQFSHVYVIVRDKRTGQWVPLDSTVPNSFAGWEPPMIYRSRTYRGMGDDQPTYQPLVAAPPAPAGLGPKAQFAYNLTAPLTQAFASQIAHGTTPSASATANLNLGLGGASGLPTWVWLLGIGGVIWMFTRSGR
jgi:hypothetical protein